MGEVEHARIPRRSVSPRHGAEWTIPAAEVKIPHSSKSRTITALFLWASGQKGYIRVKFLRLRKPFTVINNVMPGSPVVIHAIQADPPCPPQTVGGPRFLLTTDLVLGKIPLWPSSNLYLCLGRLPLL
ncbi:hypothetical protein RRG08_045438 [Elysia crispata]|uniref:Uncharacterized protein n=1 Tax=Elysia crispata TaxID=231223 RepID=A0AAE1E780_9GAST|nr:hypothetical protein RRG08_045438 [Elysia crispata]